MWLISRQFADDKELSNVSTGTHRDSFAIPAREAAFDFDVTVHCTPATSGRRRISPWLENREFGHVLEVVRETVRPIGRRHSIFKPGEAEQGMNEGLEHHFATTTNRSIVRRWTVRIDVDVPEEVRALMRRALEERYGIETKAEAADLHIRKTNQSRLGWERFLNDAAASSVARHAIQLSEDPRNIAATVDSLRKDRREGTEELLKLVKGIVEAHQAAGLLELSVNSDTVLRKTLELMGLDLPPLDPEAILTPTRADS